MCGLLFAKLNNIQKSDFLASLMLMEHRGPDVSGKIYEDNNVYLGHNRLSILDINPRSNQPFSSEDGRYILIYNGEIYNYLELANKYEIQLKTSSDTELLIKLYIKLGPKCLDQLNGIFAFVIYDTIEKNIFAARDRLGVKPLYYYDHGETLIFSSEISSIIKLTNETKIDPFALKQYRLLRTFFNGRTIYKNIKMFPAGSFYKNNRINSYWKFQKTEQAAPTDEELRYLIEDSVRCRLVSDVPVGSYLSGGIDSTIIAKLSRTEHTWTIGSKTNNEFDYAALAAKSCSSQHHEVEYNAEEFYETAKELIKFRMEPFSVPNEVLIYLMTKKVKQKNTVILSGEGADELFFGYDRIFRWANETKTFNIEKFADLYAYGSVKDLEIIEDALEPFMHFSEPISIVAAFFQTAHLHGLLRRLDNSTMLCSVEAREPFVDYRLIERMAGVPFNYRMKDGIVKAPLKRIFKDIIPKEIIERKKVGFPVKLEEVIPPFIKGDTPMDRWFNFNLQVLGIDEV